MKHTVILRSCDNMSALNNRSVSLVVTSPPYYDLKDYNTEGQFGHGQSYRGFLGSMKKVMAECFRVLDGDGKLVINTGDVFQPGRKYRKRILRPLAADYTRMGISLGLDYYYTIIWVKTASQPMNPCSGSYPYPTNGIVPLMHEYIIVFRKKGKRSLPLTKENRELSALEWPDWIRCHTGLWHMPGEDIRGMDNHPAPYPIELPSRCIMMFSYHDDLILDPFLGSGTTMRAADQLGRRCVGFELNEEYLKVPGQPEYEVIR